MRHSESRGDRAGNGERAIGHVRQNGQGHYGQPALYAAIVAALQRAGKDPARITPEDLAPVDE